MINFIKKIISFIKKMYHKVSKFLFAIFFFGFKKIDCLYSKISIVFNTRIFKTLRIGKIYYWIAKHSNYIFIPLCLIIFGTLAILVVYFLTGFFFYPIFDMKALYTFIILIAISFILAISLNFFNWFIGDELIWIVKQDMTENLFTLVIKGTILIAGERGAGKDTLSVIIAVIKSRYYRLILKERIKDAKLVLYMFNFKSLFKLVDENYEYIFKSAAKKNQKAKFQNCLKDSHNRCIKDYYVNTGVTFDELIKDYDIFKINEDESNDKFKYTDSIKQTHYLDALFDIAYYHFRLNIIKTFIFSNQPVIDDENNPAFIFANAYKMFKGASIPIKNPDNKNDHKEYKKKVMFPLTDFSIVISTEQDIFKGNYQQGVASDVKEGERPFDAVRRQITGEFYCEIKNIQFANREHKLIREFNDFIIQLENREEKNVEPLRRSGLAIRKVFTKIGIFLNLEPNVLDMLYQEIKRLTLRIDTILADGFLEFTAYIRKGDNQLEPKDMSLDKYLESCWDSKIPRCARIIFYAFKRDGWGKYRTDYIDDAADETRELSVHSILDAPKWQDKLATSRLNIIHLDNNLMDKYSGLNFEDIVSYRYDVIESPKKKDKSEKKPTTFKAVG